MPVLKVKPHPAICGSGAAQLCYPLARAQAVFEKSDQQHTLVHEDFTIQICFRHRDDASDLVAVQLASRHNRGNLVLRKLRLLPDLAAGGFAHLPPLEILKTFVERFGVEIGVGDWSGKFLLQTVVRLTNLADCSEILRLPKNVPTFAQCFFKGRTDADGKPESISVGLAFAIDLSAYLNWIGDYR